ncbi:MAG: hypothetical protein V4717_12240 [Bacteroidota bacterium]
MNLAQLVCDRLEISHYDLSVLIGAKRITVSKAAAGERTLPYEPYIKFVALYKLLPTENESAYATPISETEKNYFRELAAKNKHRLQSLEQKLEAVKSRWAKAVALTATLDAWTTANNLDRKQQNWCEELQYKASKRQQQNSPFIQLQIEAEMQLLQQSIALYESIVSHEA